MTTLVRIAFALAGLLAIGLGFWLRHMNARTTGWPMVKGRVMTSRLENDQDGNPTPYVKYRYKVQGQEHESEQVSYQVKSARSGTGATDLIARYPVGKSVDVFYDPDQPGRAVLERGASNLWIALVGVGLLFLGYAWLSP
jgi:hypothetical protein